MNGAFGEKSLLTMPCPPPRLGYFFPYLCLKNLSVESKNMFFLSVFTDLINTSLNKLYIAWAQFQIQSVGYCWQISILATDVEHGLSRESRYYQPPLLTSCGAESDLMY